MVHTCISIYTFIRESRQFIRCKYSVADATLAKIADFPEEASNGNLQNFRRDSEYSTTLQTGRSQVRLAMVSEFFSMTLTCLSHYGPGVDSASNRNDYQVCFLSSGMLLGVKAAGA